MSATSSARRRLLVPLLVLAAATLAVVVLTLGGLYLSTAGQQRRALIDLNRAHARLVATLVDRALPAAASEAAAGDAAWDSVLEWAEDISPMPPAFAEIVIGRPDGDWVVLGSNRDGVRGPDGALAIAARSALQEPMRRAVAGDSGILVARDADGRAVLAAYEPLGLLDAGSVATLPLDQLRTPFLLMGLLVGGTSVALLLIGMWLFASAGRASAQTTIESEVMYRALFDSASDALLFGSETVDDCNARAAEMFGYSHDELLGKGPLELAPPLQPDGCSSEERLRERALHALRGLPQHFEFWWRRRDGDLVHTETSLTAIPVGERMLLLGNLRDLTERRLMEEEIRQKERSYFFLAETAPVGIFRADATGAIHYLNRRFGEILGLTIEDTVSGWQPAVHPDDRDRVVAAWAEALRTAGKLDEELRFIRRDGAEIWVVAQASPEFDEHGKLAGHVGTVLDITARKNVEQEREALLAQLEAKNVELERYSYTVSHDLKSPLVTIAGFVKRLEKAASARDPDAVAAHAKRVQAALGRMTGLLDGLLALSRAGRITGSLREVSLTDVADEVALLLLGDRDRPEATLALTIARDMPTVRADPDRLRQVLQNLLENAMKFRDPGRLLSVEIGARQVGSEVVCHVRDNGKGIDARHHGAIFDTFAQLDAESRGLGLGLSLVHRIIAAHGGRVWVESEGQGTTFFFSLPVVAGNGDDAES